MAPLAYALSGIASLGTLVCFILVLVQMFQRGETTLGIVLIVLCCCFGIGFLATYIYGWVKSTQWGIRNIMLVWTGCIVLEIVSAAMHPAQFQQIQIWQGN